MQILQHIKEGIGGLEIVVENPKGEMISNHIHQIENLEGAS